MKSKKILGLLLVVTLLSATVFGTASVFAAGAQTNVKLESYMPPVKTIFVDDDFENRAEGESVAPIAEGETGYRANQVKSIDKTVVAGKESGNIYANYSTTYSRVDLCDKIISTQAKKMVISFKFDMRTFAGGNTFTIRFGNQTGTKAFQFQMTGNNGVRISKYNTSGVTQIIQNINKNKENEWVDFKVILAKGDIDSGALIEKIFVDGAEISLKDDIRQLNSDCNWWKEAASNNSVKTINIGENAAKNLRLDNVLIYEPYDVYMTDIDAVKKTVKIVNDGSNAVEGNVFIALYDNDKNLLAAKEASTALSVPAGGSQTVPLNDETFGHADAKTAKIFFWNKSSLAPLCAAETVPLS